MVKREEFDVRVGLAQEVDPVGVVGVFHGHALPNVGSPRQFVVELGQVLGALGQDLVAVPAGLVHDSKDLLDEGERHVPVEQVAHGIDEDGLRALPAEGEGKGVFVEHDPEAIAVMGVADGLQAMSHALGVAVFAAGADLGTARYGVPGGFGPLN
jgi:Glu-tRNA(Gln) amidotransferase subunit E-like FAD-binding protein